MIPKIKNINIGDELEIAKEPTYTWKIEGNRIIGYTDGIEAMKQAIYLMLNVERYRYLIYDWNYGVELADLFGKDKSYIYSELKRRIKEALLIDDRIISVDEFIFESKKKNTINLRFIVNTIFGEIKTSREVSL